MDVNVVVVELVVVDVDVVEVKLVVVALVVVPGRRTIVVESVLIWHLTRGVNKSLSNYTNDEMNRHLVPCHFSLQKQAPVVSLQPTLPRARH